MKAKDYPERIPRYILTMPVIYGVIIPAVIWDAGIEIYHRVCFPLYGLPYINRSHYIRIDHHRLSYLTPWEKLNCVYCGYVNGLLAYSVKIVGETEKFWCAIRHEPGGTFHEPAHHKDFLPYGDKKAFVQRYRRAN